MQANRKQTIRVIFPIILAVCATWPAVAGTSYIVAPRSVVLERLRSAPKANSDRGALLAEMFRYGGCQPSEQPVKGSHQSNVICVLPGKSDAVIVVGGHFDKAPHGDGIVDDWSGASLLPSLYQSLAKMQRNHTFVFIGFTEEETGLVGSRFYTKALEPDKRKHIAAMINLECLGVSTTKVWASHSDPQLLQLLIGVAQTLKFPLEGVDVEQVGTADSESFAHYKIPRTTIHSLTQDTLPILHSDRDTLKEINEDDYYQSYQLISAYLAVIDTHLGQPASSPATSGGTSASK